MHPPRANATTVAFLLVFAAGTIWSQVRFNSPQPGDVYREYTHVMVGDEPQVRDPNIDTNKFPYLYAPPIYLDNIDLSGAVRAEAVITYLGGHVSTIGQKWRWNGSDWIDIPLLDASNGIPAGHQGYDYLMLHDITLDVPLSLLHSGSNWFQGTTGTQGDPRYSFGWGQWGWAAIILRVYYGSGLSHATGNISSQTSGGTLSENPTIAATVTGGSAQQIDFLAYYEDYDTDGDGIYLQYHQDYMDVAGSGWGLRNHVGTATGSPWSVTWHTDWVPDQAAGQVKLLARIRDNNGVWYVTPEVTNLTLARNGFSIKLYKPLDMPERCWVKGDVDQGYGYGHQIIHFDIPSSDNLGNATAARYYMRTWNGLNGVEGDQTPYSEYRHLNNWADDKFGADHGYSFDARTIPVSALQSGTNTWHWYNTVAVHHGIEVEWPGPVIAVRYSGSPSNNPPSITLQPLDQTVAEGQTATFTVGATGSGTLGYQWQRNQSDIGGAINQSYTTPALTASDSGAHYRCVVKNAYGQAVSNEAVLKVNSVVAPNITVDPTPVTVADGQPATFSVTATGTAPLTYLWQKNSVGIGGTNNPSYSISVATSADSGAFFRCIVSNAKGADTSNSALLKVTPVLPAFTSHPANVQAGPGDTVTFSVTVTGSLPRYYDWEKNGTPVPGANSSSYSFVAAKQDSGAAYRCKVTNAAGSVTSNPGYLIIGTFPPKITQHPVQAFVRLGQTATFSVTATGSRTLKYQWQRDSVDITGAISSSYTTTPVVLDDNGRSFRCVVTNDYGSATSESAILSVTSDIVNLIANGDFETGTAPWTFFTNGSGTFANDSTGPSSAHAAHLGITTAGDNVQLAQANIQLQADTAYTLMFKAYSSSGHDVDVFLHKDTSPYTSYVQWQPTFDLTQAWQTFRRDFTATGFTGTVSDARLRFWLAPYDAAGDRFFVDDVVLVKSSMLVAPTFTRQPLSRNVNEGETATFSIAVSGTTPFAYQWEKNQTAIPGATSASYTTPPTIMGDNNAQFRCVVTNVVSVVTSDPATLTVMPLVSVKESKELMPTQFSLAQNHPNPFNPSTVIQFGVPVAGHVTIKVSNLLGQEVRTLVDDFISAGTHEVRFIADGLPSGVYLYRMQSGSFVATKKLILIR